MRQVFSTLAGAVRRAPALKTAWMLGCGFRLYLVRTSVVRIETGSVDVRHASWRNRGRALSLLAAIPRSRRGRVVCVRHVGHAICSSGIEPPSKSHNGSPRPPARDTSRTTRCRQRKRHGRADKQRIRMDESGALVGLVCEASDMRMVCVPSIVLTLFPPSPHNAAVAQTRRFGMQPISDHFLSVSAQVGRPKRIGHRRR